MQTHPKDPQGVPLRTTASSRVPRISLSYHVLFPGHCRVSGSLIWGRRDTESLRGLGKDNKKWSKTQYLAKSGACNDRLSLTASEREARSTAAGLAPIPQRRDSHLIPPMDVGSLVDSRLAGPGSHREHFHIPTYPSHRVRASGRFAVAKTRPYSILAPRAAGGWSFFQWTLCVFLFLPVLHLAIYHVIYVALFVGHHNRHRSMSPQRYLLRHEARGSRLDRLLSLP